MTDHSVLNLKKDILIKEYDLDSWQRMIKQLFKNVDLFPIQGRESVLNEVEYVTRAFQYGLVYLSDERRIALIDVELNNTKQISRNRVQLRDLAAKLVIGSFSGVLAVFHTKGQSDYRLSLITKTSAFSNEGNIELKQTFPKRYTYLLGPNESCTTAAQQLTILAETLRPTLEDVVSAFSVEKVSNDFFKEYKYHYEKKFLPHLEALAKNDGRLFSIHEEGMSKKERESRRNKEVRDFVKRLLGRIVFLYFVQKKEWLGVDLEDANYERGGDVDFLKNFFLEAIQSEPGQFYAKHLARLFFDTLNNPDRTNDSFEMPSGNIIRVPYLNGGLFDEQQEPDRQLISFPPELFHQSDENLAETPNQRGLFDFMNSYNFTIYEDSPDDQTVAVDPEMLGHIFENLLEENREKGAIYTPREVVHFMCQQSLIKYLDTHITNPEDRVFVKQLVSQKLVKGIPRQLLDKVDHYLKQVRICDPAIGSGAFPVGLLQEIFSIKEAIYFEQGFQAWSRARAKEDIIQQSIYGVDIDAGAVDIARLRFWLSLIVDESKPRPLPNLDFKIVVGDSLVPKFEGEIINIDWNTSTVSGNESLLEGIKNTLTKIVQKQKEFFKLQNDGHPVNPEEKQKALLQIRELKINFLIYQLTLTKLRFEASNAATGQIFAQPSPKEKALQMQTAERVRGYEAFIQQLNMLRNRPERSLNFFDWKLDFAGVINEEVADDRIGFDIVIANPPYMRVQEIKKSFPHEKVYYESDKDLKEVAKQAYDLANLFVVLAVKKLSHADTVNCFIFPHKFFNSDSATSFREFLMRGQYMDKILHFGANRVFNDADTYVCIALFSQQKNKGFLLQKIPYLPSRQNKHLTEEMIQLMTDESRYEGISYEQLKKASKFYNGNQWLFFSGIAGYDLFEKIYQSGSRRFSEVFNIFVGLQTSGDKLYLLKIESQDDRYLWGKNGLSEELWQVEKTFFKPMLRGRDMQRYAPLQTDNYVFFPYLIRNQRAEPVSLDLLKREYPLTFQYIIKQEEDFKSRERGRAGDMEYWYEYIYPKNLVKFEQLKLSSMEICTTHANVTLDENNFYHSTTVYSWIKSANVPESYEYLLAIANSSVLWWFLKNTGDTLQGDARRFKSNYLNPFPLPNYPTPAIESAIATLVRYLLWLNDPDNPAVHPSVSNKSVATYLRQVVDGCVCELYVGAEMREKEVDILQYVISEVEVGKVDTSTIGKLFQRWQAPESPVRNRLKLFNTRSPDVLGALLNA